MKARVRKTGETVTIRNITDTVAGGQDTRCYLASNGEMYLECELDFDNVVDDGTAPDWEERKWQLVAQLYRDNLKANIDDTSIYNAGLAIAQANDLIKTYQQSVPS